MNYCTVADVMTIVRPFYTDIDDDNLGSPTLSSENIASLIPVASEMTVQDYSPRYDVTVIDAFDPDFPRGITRLTALYTAELLYNSMGASNVERNTGLKSLLNTEIAFWKRVLMSGGLRNDLNVLISTQAGPSAQTPDWSTNIETQYPDGLPRYYN